MDENLRLTPSNVWSLKKGSTLLEKYLSYATTSSKQPLFQIILIFVFISVTFTLGDVIDPHSKLYMMIYGTKGDSGKLYLSPSDGSEFVKGRTYKVIADLRDIGDVSLTTLLGKRRSRFE
jgi:hypothetical protein